MFYFIRVSFDQENVLHSNRGHVCGCGEVLRSDSPIICSFNTEEVLKPHLL